MPIPLPSDAPAPGGGSCAALYGSIGAALTAMVGGLTQGRKKYAEYAEHAAEVEKKGNELKTRLLDVMDRDTGRSTSSPPRSVCPRRPTRRRLPAPPPSREGLKGCTKTPMEMMELIDETLTLAQSLLGRFNDTSASDLGVAFLSLKAGIRGAWLNVLINVGSLKDQEFAAEYRAKGGPCSRTLCPLPTSATLRSSSSSRAKQKDPSKNGFGARTPKPFAVCKGVVFP